MEQHCDNCKSLITSIDKCARLGDGIVCVKCWKEYWNEQVKLFDTVKFDKVEKPEHYHKNGMDTFTFLEKGFKPEITRGFYIGNIIKYLQRAEDKGGIEDYRKAAQYMKTLLEFEEKREQ